jgi:Flp pilus assembly CpaF family ATPase
MATIHAQRPEIAVSRLAYYVAKSNTQLPEFAVWSLIADTIDFVIHVDLVRNERSTDPPQRRITSIREISGLGERGGVASTEVWGLDGDTGRLVPIVALEPRHARQMELAGYRAGDFAPAGQLWN